MSKQTNSTKMLHRCLHNERYRQELDARADNDLQDQRQDDLITYHEALHAFDVPRYVRSILS